MGKTRLLCSSTKVVSSIASNISPFVSKFIGDYMIEHGKVFATPAITEKGYLDVLIDVQSPGGHSCVPPPHTVNVNSPSPHPLVHSHNYRPSVSFLPYSSVLRPTRSWQNSTAVRRCTQSLNASQHMHPNYLRFYGRLCFVPTTAMKHCKPQRKFFSKIEYSRR